MTNDVRVVRLRYSTIPRKSVPCESMYLISTLAFDTGMRNEAAALSIATLSFSDQPNVAVVVVVFGMMQFIIMGVIAYYWSKKSKGSQDIKLNTKG
jgi:predicted Na+-dependent transporter